MGMRLRRAQSALWAVVSAATLLMLPVTSLSSVRAAYRGDCADGQKGFAHAVVSRNSSHNYNAVIGDAIVRPLQNCLNPTASKYSYSLVLPANLQGDGSGEIVQIGYSRCGETGGCGPHWPKDSHEHFVYTPDDDNGGVLVGFTAAGEPEVGKRYRFKVEKIDVNLWRYCIRNLTDGGSYHCQSTFRSWANNGVTAWWGTEIQDTEAAMGPACCVDIDMRWMQYHRVSQNDWMMVDQQPSCEKILQDGITSWPSYWHCYMTSTADTDGDGSINDLDTLRRHTDDH